MSQCYSMSLAFKVKQGKEQELIKAMQQKLADGKKERTNYHLDEYVAAGMDINNLHDLIAIVFGYHVEEDEYEIDTLVRKEGTRTMSEWTELNGFTICTSEFEGGYSWESVMGEMWAVMSAYLEDRSSIKFEVDYDYYYNVVENGSIKGYGDLQTFLIETKCD